MTPENLTKSRMERVADPVPVAMLCLLIVVACDSAAGLPTLPTSANDPTLPTLQDADVYRDGYWAPDAAPLRIRVIAVTLEPQNECTRTYGANPDAIDVGFGSNPSIVHYYEPHIWPYYSAEEHGDAVTAIRWFGFTRQTMTVSKSGVISLYWETYEEGVVADTCDHKGRGTVVPR